MPIAGTCRVAGYAVAGADRVAGQPSPARHARDLCRPVMAVPRPVTSGQTAGCHELIRD